MTSFNSTVNSQIINKLNSMSLSLNGVAGMIVSVRNAIADN